jgi:hypothetical protein
MDNRTWIACRAWLPLLRTQYASRLSRPAPPTARCVVSAVTGGGPPIAKSKCRNASLEFPLRVKASAVGLELRRRS